MSEDPIARGKRWLLFYNEDGGLKDIFDHIAQTYLERLAATSPDNVQSLQVMALAHRITREAQAMVQDIISNGQIAEKDKEYTTRMLAIPAEKRRRM